MTIGKKISGLLKIILSLAALGYVAYRIANFGHWEGVGTRILDSLTSYQLIFLVLPLLLVPVNFGFETLKWGLVIRPLERLSPAKALTGILTGLSMSILTPNRIGDIVTRSFILQPGNRVGSTGLTSVNSLAQTVITLVFGIPAALYYLYRTGEATTAEHHRILLLFGSALITGFGAIWLFMKLHIAVRWAGRIGFKNQFQKISDALAILQGSFKLRVLTLSTMKYIVYLTQFYLLMRFFGLDITIPDGWACLGTTYLFLTLVPFPSLGDPGIRGSVTLFLLGPFTADLPGILFASWTIWLINIIIPALIGLFLLPRIKI
ncbi:MAG: flippase-like domain-containing protein [Bacteroidales bacterium]|nr:flippase-like domain-containing protein [Bacteroidales bacterium]